VCRGQATTAADAYFTYNNSDTIDHGWGPRVKSVVVMAFNHDNRDYDNSTFNNLLVTVQRNCNG